MTMGSQSDCLYRLRSADDSIPAGWVAVRTEVLVRLYDQVDRLQYDAARGPRHFLVGFVGGLAIGVLATLSFGGIL